MEAATRQIRFVGREQELAWIEDRLGAAAAGAGQVLLLAGEPGAGKSRLAEQAAAVAARLGMRCCWGRATDEEGNPAYWPFRQVLRALEQSEGAQDGPGGGRDRPEGGRDRAEGGRDRPAGLVVPDFGAMNEAESRFRLFEDVSGLLAAGAGKDGLLVVLDDLHWADEASLRLLVYLARGAAAARLAVLAIYRDTEIGEPLRRTLAALAGEASVTRVRLTGLAESEVGDLLAGVTGWPSPEPVVGAVSRRTRGNPFFVTELARLLGGEQGDEAELPAGVRDAVRGRLDRLSAWCGQVVSAAAVLGSAVDPPALAAAAGWEVAEVLDALDEAAAAGILTTARDARAGGTGSRFGHDLIREAARLEVGTAQRLTLHRRMAEHLIGRVDAADRTSEVAFHLLESLPAGDAALAAAWAERAAEQAMAQLAWEEAAALYGRAVAVAGDAALSGPDRCRLLLARARAQVRAYDMVEARRSLLAAVDLAREAGDARTVGEAAMIMEGVSDFVWDDVGAALYAEALAGIPEQDSVLRARLLAQYAVSHAWSSPGEAETRSAEALAMAERVGDRRAVKEALRARQLARSGPDGVTDRLALGDRMLAMGEADRDDDAVLWGRLWRFDALAQLGRLDRAEAELAPIDVVARRLRSPLTRWHALRCRAAIALARGRFDDAVVLGEQALELSRRAGHEGALVPSHAFLLNLRILTGSSGEPIDAPGPVNPGIVVVPAIWASFLVAAGRREEARQVYRTLQPATSSSVPPFLLVAVFALITELAAEFGDRETAARTYPAMMPYADLFACGGAGVITIHGSMRLPLGRAAATLGRLDDAVRHLRAAAEVNERAGTPPMAAFSRYELARVLARRRRPGDRDEAAALAESAGAAAGELGMAPLRASCAELARSLSGRVAGPLTRREDEIAVLVSQGLTSRQIAAAAHIAERTVENHVQHILVKLGFTNRAQIAAWVASGRPRRPEGPGSE
ncbi:putative ATPase [Nonomuraea fuscirosea]|uniref:Putative ATPase n=1 Tax=Nonomuraea fuscirosea TaxID=1291556 RepID=A0A2T0N7X4_9ACTN|nr:putative ATPase [Nonomuraea fuscirosea]